MTRYASTFTSTVDGLTSLPVHGSGTGCRLAFDAPAGLYQVSIIADARAFNWDSLYLRLNWYHNEDVRTGPWDFDLHHDNRPLMPAYWVELDGRRLGLWCFQRVSLDDIAHRRFRGRMAFRLPDDGPHELRWTPYGDVAVEWISAQLDPDPEDSLAPIPAGLAPASASVIEARWPDPAFWDERRRELTGTHRMFRPLLDARFGSPVGGSSDLSALAMAYYLDGRTEALAKALATIDAMLDLPALSNPKPDGYGHRGDLGAMYPILELARALHTLRPHLGDERRQRMHEKLREHIDVFLDGALLSRDYWGGSVLQDHGWRSHWGVATAVLLLYGEIPAAEEWLRYWLPRVDKALLALPRDGVIPFSSYGRPMLYVDPVAEFRRTFLAMGGGDIYQRAPLHKVVDYLAEVFDDENGVIPMGRLGDVQPPEGGVLFLQQMAALHGDGRAAWLAQRFLAIRSSVLARSGGRGIHNDSPWEFLSYVPAAAAPSRPAPAASRAGYFADSGLVYARTGDLALRVECGPSNGYHGHVTATGPCDRLAYAVAAGHFSLTASAKPLLVTPDTGYRLRTDLSSVLLIGGCGQSDDVGYPMSIPSARHKGEHIVSVRHDRANDRIHVILDLAPAYADSLGVAHYTRDLVLWPGGGLCRDHVVLDAPRELSWLFQGKPDFGLRLEGLTGIFGASRVLRLSPRCGACALKASMQPTPVVWSYRSDSGFKPFAHVRYDTIEPVREVTVEFGLSLDAS